MKWLMTGFVVAFCWLVFSSMNAPNGPEHVQRTVSRFNEDAKHFASSLAQLKLRLEKLTEKDSVGIQDAITQLKQCRLAYKRIEFFMEYFFEYPVNLYNRAPVYEVEEPYMEYQSPVGMQVIEDLLLDDDPFKNKKELIDQCEVLYTTAHDIPAILYEFKATDAEVMEALRLELVRILTLGITGYDAPQIKTGIEESAVVMAVMKENLEPLLATHKSREADSVLFYLDQSIHLLKSPVRFDQFDRMKFFTEAGLPLQKHFGRFLKEQHLVSTRHKVMNYDADHLFSKNGLNLSAFSTNNVPENNDDLVALGKELFFEQSLSGNGKRSCASCHQPEKYFTDGLVKSKTLDGKGEVTRNAPTLLYAAYQHMQFYDGRAGNLEEQIKAVLQNPIEMNADPEKIIDWLGKDEHYTQAFRKAFNVQDDSGVTFSRLATALAAFEKSLTPFNSSFDEYISGNKNALNTSQIKGFNLFMGKAQCGTCHFAPAFNSLLPPYYERSEIEVLGVPASNNRRSPKADVDSGRSGFFNISFNNGAFKTSTVRNAAMTAPYMHNGVFKTMKQVIDFYNKGGGVGMKLQIDNQTLSDKPLHLTNKEIDQLAAFMESLTDKPFGGMSKK